MASEIQRASCNQHYFNALIDRIIRICGMTQYSKKFLVKLDLRERERGRERAKKICYFSICIVVIVCREHVIHIRLVAWTRSLQHLSSSRTIICDPKQQQ